MQARPDRKLTKEVRINIRASLRQKEVIMRAAKIRNTTISEFILGTSFEAAHQIIADQPNIALSPRQWKQFCRALDAPPRSNPRLMELLREPGIFDDK